MRSLGTSGIAPRYVATPFLPSDTDDTASVRRSSVSLFFYIDASSRLRSSTKHSHLASSLPPPLCPFFRHPRRPSRSAPCRCPHSLSPCSRRLHRCPNSVSGSSSLDHFLFYRFPYPFHAFLVAGSCVTGSPISSNRLFCPHAVIYLMRLVFLSLYSCGFVCLVAIDPNEYAALLSDAVRPGERGCGQGLDRRCYE